jgi:hypothetical protein
MLATRGTTEAAWIRAGRMQFSILVHRLVSCFVAEGVGVTQTLLARLADAAKLVPQHQRVKRLRAV